MLQIKKNSTLMACKYNMLYLFKRRGFDATNKPKKQKTSTVLLRSPKHFNIGKQKITNLNYRTPNMRLPVASPLNLLTLLTKPSMLYRILIKGTKTNPVLRVSSLRVQVRTTFKLKWLETLFLLLLLTQLSFLLFFEF